MSPSPTVSVVVNTKNSELYLDKALQSVSFATEIIVVDMQSSDGTREIAKKYTKNVFDFKDVGYVEPARNFALSKAKSEWVLVLDSDEEVTESLQKKILATLASPSADAYYIPRRNEVFGHVMEKTGWWPDYQMRLFKRGTIEWSDEIHSVPKIRGKVESFPPEPQAALLHHNYQHVDQFVERMNRYTDVQSRYIRSDSQAPAQIIEAFKDELLRRLFQHKGIDEGMHGVGLSFLQSFYSVLLVLKKWEEQGFEETEADQEETIQALESFQHDISYWIDEYRAQRSPFLTRFIIKVRRKIGL